MPRFNRAYRGLYGNRMIQFGNKISFAENKSRRTWKPNIQKKSMFSETLQRKLTFRLSTHVMRCIRKFGGIDEYLVRTKDSELKYDKAIALKEEIVALRKSQRSRSGHTNRGGPSSGDAKFGDTPHAPKQGGLNDTTPHALNATRIARSRSLGLIELL